MKYRLDITAAARQRIKRFDSAIQDRVLAAIRELAETPRPSGCKKLRGRPGFRIRVGDYRVIYDIHDRIVTVEIIEVGHRKDIYR